MFHLRMTIGFFVADANFAREVCTRRSISGLILMFAGAPIS